MLKQKDMALLARYSSLVENTTSLPSSDSIATPRKIASGNWSKNINLI
jgi:hypothetical protein